MSDNVHPIVEPDAGQMLRHVQHLFGGELDGKIELTWTDGRDGRLRHADLFGTDQLEDLVERATRENRIPGQNVYVGQALRKPDIAPCGRCSDEDFFALTAFYADLDDDVIATARISYRHRGCPPTGVVVTGRHPHVRAQMLWRLETPERDPETCRRQNRALADALGGDSSVVNPGRVMRLGGSVAWPVKPDRIVERTEFLTFDDGRPRVYLPGQLARAFPPASPESPDLDAPRDNSSKLHIGSEFDGVTVDAWLAAIRAGDHWHANLVRLTGHWIARGWSDAEILPDQLEQVEPNAAMIDVREPMIGPAGYRSCLARHQRRAAPRDEDLQAMRRAAWRSQGVVVLRPEDVRDDWTRQALINEANRLYGRRPGGGR